VSPEDLSRLLCLIRLRDPPCSHALDGAENASTTTPKNQRSDIEDTILNGKKNVDNRM
jgi:hypothetical protein